MMSPNSFSPNHRTLGAEMTPSGLSQVGSKCPAFIDPLMPQAGIECGYPWTGMTLGQGTLQPRQSPKGCSELRADHDCFPAARPTSES